MNVLVFNAGSSSLKFSLLQAEQERLLLDGGIDWSSEPARLVLHATGRPILTRDLRVRRHGEAVARLIEELRDSAPAIDAVGHRIVHGGSRYTSAVRITPEVRNAIAELCELAPLHNVASLAVIRAVTKAMPRIPQVACFDTAFHATLPEAARTYPIPRAWTRDWDVRRFGFHGLSHQYCATRAAEMLGRGDLRLIIAHLGNGASVSAVHNGRCVDTSMGFTPMEGLMMGTRSGSVDPGLLIYLMREEGFDFERLDQALNHESGLLGVSGVSSDMRVLLAAMHESADARLAIDMYIHRLRQTIGAMAAVLGGADAIVFTAGVGENAPEIRRRACEGFGFLGIQLDEQANLKCKADANVASAGSAARLLVIATREDLTIVREVRGVLANSEPAASTDISNRSNASTT
jgi:acetate kinase